MTNTNVINVVSIPTYQTLTTETRTNTYINSLAMINKPLTNTIVYQSTHSRGSLMVSMISSSESKNSSFTVDDRNFPPLLSVIRPSNNSINKDSNVVDNKASQNLFSQSQIFSKATTSCSGALPRSNLDTPWSEMSDQELLNSNCTPLDLGQNSISYQDTFPETLTDAMVFSKKQNTIQSKSTSIPNLSQLCNKLKQAKNLEEFKAELLLAHQLANQIFSEETNKVHNPICNEHSESSPTNDKSIVFRFVEEENKSNGDDDDNVLTNKVKTNRPTVSQNNKPDSTQPDSQKSPSIRFIPRAVTLSGSISPKNPPKGDRLQISNNSDNNSNSFGKSADSSDGIIASSNINGSYLSSKDGPSVDSSGEGANIETLVNKVSKKNYPTKQQSRIWSNTNLKRDSFLPMQKQDKKQTQSNNNGDDDESSQFSSNPTRALKAIGPVVLENISATLLNNPASIWTHADLNINQIKSTRICGPKRDNLLVFPDTSETQTKLLNMNFSSIKPRLALSRKANIDASLTVVARGVPLFLTEETLSNEIGATCKRIVSAISEKPTMLVKVTFTDSFERDAALRNGLSLGYPHHLHFKTETYQNESNFVARCTRCQSLKHRTKDCTQSLTCGKCSQAHDTKSCKVPPSQFLCANCGGKHPAYSSTCPEIQNIRNNTENKALNFAKQVKSTINKTEAGRLACCISDTLSRILIDKLEITDINREQISTETTHTILKHYQIKLQPSFVLGQIQLNTQQS